MIRLTRFKGNPILTSNKENPWERMGTFNGCPIEDNGKFHIVYRALSNPLPYRNFNLPISSIGYAQGSSETEFTNHRLLIKPEEEWEIFGCEDPRITKINGKYFIFYTALSTYPFTAQGIKVGLAITHDFQKIEEKHPVTFFNSKAMTLFPETVNGKMAALLTVDTDIPPAKMALSLFDKEEDIWSRVYWENWFSSFNNHVIPLLHSLEDHLEVGAPPIKTDKGWLILYSYIHNYLRADRTFGVEALLLDLNNPQKVLGRIERPILIPEEKYELEGNVPRVVFPTGAISKGKELLLYYGAADTTCCLASCNLEELLNDINITPKVNFEISKTEDGKLKRFEGNPIISPIPEFSWESRATFNPAAIYEGEKLHLIYRAMSQDNTSVFGYATSKDGFNLTERLTYPVYVPREKFEMKTKPYGNSGCEDPRLTKIDQEIYMCYTAFDGTNPPRVALTSINTDDFLKRLWTWKKPKLISPPGIDDKDACLFPKKINGKYVFCHRIGLSIWMETVDDLNFTEGKWLGGEILVNPRKDKWDSVKVGISAPPIETKNGWLLLYHGVDANMEYNVGALLLDLGNPRKIIARTENPLLEPEMSYEKEGQVQNVVFPCGAVAISDNLLIYYGGGDKTIGIAYTSLSGFLAKLVGEQ